jgi:nicotinate-nucleotide adenylyltransferase
LFLLLGGDTLHDLANWREPERICQLARLLVVCRPTAPEPDYAALARLAGEATAHETRLRQVDMPQIDLSSSDLRSRVARGASIRYRTPRAVEKYVETQRLYRDGSPHA